MGFYCYAPYIIRRIRGAVKTSASFLLLTAPLISGDPLPGDQRQTEGAALHGLKNKRLVFGKKLFANDHRLLKGQTNIFISTMLAEN